RAVAALEEGSAQMHAKEHLVDGTEIEVFAPAAVRVGAAFAADVTVGVEEKVDLHPQEKAAGEKNVDGGCDDPREALRVVLAVGVHSKCLPRKSRPEPKSEVEPPDGQNRADQGVDAV